MGGSATIDGSIFGDSRKTRVFISYARKDDHLTPVALPTERVEFRFSLKFRTEDRRTGCSEAKQSG